MSDSIQFNKHLVLSVFEEMWNAHKPSAARTIFSQPEGVERFVTQFLAGFPDLHHMVEEIIAEGDKVAVRFSAQGTHLGRWKDYPASGHPIHYTGLILAQIVDGKITIHHTWWDTFEVIEQITKPGEKSSG